MAVTEQQAVEIARAFAGAGIKPRPVHIERGEGGYATEYLGIGKKHWLVTFDRELPPELVGMSPSDVTVFVDEETGRPVFFDAL